MIEFSDTGIIIPALKKNVTFKDDLIKKLAGISLVQRVIDKAKALGVKNESIHIVTDSDEIRLIGERNEICIFYNPNLIWNESIIPQGLGLYISKLANEIQYILLLSPYAPLLRIETIFSISREFKDAGKDAIKPVRIAKRYATDITPLSIGEIIFGKENEFQKIESTALVMVDRQIISGNKTDYTSIATWEVGDDALEITSLQDWWVCEKLLKRKRIVFHVIANKVVGMGHVYRCLSLAREFTDHEIIFACKKNHAPLIEKIVGDVYPLTISYSREELVQNIIGLNPDMVVNDILNTNREDVTLLKDRRINVINFEDLGEGSRYSDLTINELFDRPNSCPDNAVWGHDHFFLRDEFEVAKPVRFKRKVKNLLLTFGGTDQHDLSRHIIRAIRSVCRERNITIFLVAGPGYSDYVRLSEELDGDDDVLLTHSTGVISSLMEKTQIAITSNGRTLYELAHMSIPSIVIVQHEREATHSFGSEHNGFVSLGLYRKGETEKEAAAALIRLIDDVEYRRSLFDRMRQYDFSGNKGRVTALIQAFLE